MIKTFIKRKITHRFVLCLRTKNNIKVTTAFVVFYSENMEQVDAVICLIGENVAVFLWIVMS